MMKTVNATPEISVKRLVPNSLLLSKTIKITARRRPPANTSCKSYFLKNFITEFGISGGMNQLDWVPDPAGLFLTFGSQGLNNVGNPANQICRKSSHFSVFHDHLFIRRQIHTIDFVPGNITL